MTTTIDIIDYPNGIESASADASGNLKVTQGTLLAGENQSADRIMVVAVYDFAGNCSLVASTVVKDGPSAGCCIEVVAADSGITASVYDDNQIASPNSEKLVGIVSLETAGTQKEFKHKFETGVSVVLSGSPDTAVISVGVN
jgi:hypothetical protein